MLKIMLNVLPNLSLNMLIDVMLIKKTCIASVCVHLSCTLTTKII